MAKRAAAERTRIDSPEAAFGRVLKALRRSHEISQEELAHRSGYHRNYISQLERGEKSPSLRTIFDLSSSLAVQPSTVISKVEKLLNR